MISQLVISVYIPNHQKVFSKNFKKALDMYGTLYYTTQKYNVPNSANNLYLMNYDTIPERRKS